MLKLNSLYISGLSILEQNFTDTTIQSEPEIIRSGSSGNDSFGNFHNLQSLVVIDQYPRQSMTPPMNTRDVSNHFARLCRSTEEDSSRLSQHPCDPTESRDTASEHSDSPDFAARIDGYDRHCDGGESESPQQFPIDDGTEDDDRVSPSSHFNQPHFFSPDANNGSWETIPMSSQLHYVPPSTANASGDVNSSSISQHTFIDSGRLTEPTSESPARDMLAGDSLRLSMPTEQFDTHAAGDNKTIASISQHTNSSLPTPR